MICNALLAVGGNETPRQALGAEAACHQRIRRTAETAGGIWLRHLNQASERMQKLGKVRERGLDTCTHVRWGTARAGACSFMSELKVEKPLALMYSKVGSGLEWKPISR